MTQKLIKELSDMMLEKDLTQEYTAKRLKVRFATVNRWLQGHTKPNKRNSFKIKKLIKWYMED